MDTEKQIENKPSIVVRPVEITYDEAFEKQMKIDNEELEKISKSNSAVIDHYKRIDDARIKALVEMGMSSEKAKFFARNPVIN